MKLYAEMRCENCSYGVFVDSGYRNCQRYAPDHDQPRVDGYPSNPVPWDYFCGDHIERLPALTQGANDV